jgi:hypothetical protein
MTTLALKGMSPEGDSQVADQMPPRCSLALAGEAAPAWAA